MTREEVKAKLHRYRDAVEQLEVARRNLEAAENILTGVSIDYSQERVTRSTVSFDRIGDQVDELSELRRIFNEKKKAATSLILEAVSLVNLCTTAIGYDVISRRYISGQSWQEITDAMHYSFSYIFKIHADAIDEIARRYDETENEGRE